ncbi:MAG: hypothetical protein LBT39_00705 [Treponema sp.]|jgi:hypothetical protein|nr:hypothetical protein [Treponema sp.]
MGKLAAGAIFVLLPVFAALGAQENQELKLANRYYDQADYSRAYVHYQNMILGDAESWNRGKGSAGDIFYRYASCYEQIREFETQAAGLGWIARTGYALSLFYYEREGRENAPNAQSAAARLKNSPRSPAPPDETAAALLLEELRESISRERNAYLYSRTGRVDDFRPLLSLFSRLSIFQWKIAVTVAMAVIFLIGILVFKGKEGKARGA